MGKRIFLCTLCILLLLSGLPAGAVSEKRTETEWSIETVDASTWSGMYASLSLFSDNRRAAAAYYDGTNGDLRYAHHDGLRWNRETVDAFGVVGEYASLALDGQNRPRIAYYDRTNGNLKYAAWTGTTWNIVVVDAPDDVGQYASLALYDAAWPCIAYYDATHGYLKYAWNDGAFWHIGAVDTTGDAGRYASLALDNQNRPRIAYYAASSGDLRYAWNDGAVWQWEAVDTAGDVGRYASLALDANGRPHIAYYDGTSGNLKHAWSDGASWHIETVDAAGDVGRYASLKLDGSGLPHIAYYDGTNDDLKHAWSDGASWHIETVYAAGVVGQHASLALDGSDRPYIAFYDDTAGNLKWAYPCQALSASFEVPPAPYCVGETVPFTNTTVSTWTVSFLWSFGDGATSTETHPLHAYTAAGTFPVVLTATNACSQDTFSRTLELWDAPAAAFTHTVPACVDRTTAFTFTGRVSGTAFFRWEFGDKTPPVTGTATPTHVYTATGTYLVNLFVQNECGFSAAQEGLAVYEVPSAGFLHGPNPSCGTVAFTNTTAGGAAYLWDFGDGMTSTLENPVHAYAVPGFYTVTLRAWGEGGCEDRAEGLQEVWAPVSGLDMGWEPDPPAAGEVVTFTAWAEGVPPPTFTWDFGDGTPPASGGVVTHTYAPTGEPTRTYTVTVRAENACGEEELRRPVVVAAAPTASFRTNAPVCLPETVVFTSTARGAPPLSYLWSFGDGITSTLENPTHTYAAGGLYTAVLTVSNPYGRDAAAGEVEVREGPAGANALCLPQEVPPGGVVTCTASASGYPAPLFTWAFGDGEYGSGEVVTHTYAATGTYTVQMTATNACGEAAARTAVAVACCTAPSGLSLTYAPRPLLRGQVGTFTATLTAGSLPLTFAWDFDDGSPWAYGQVVTHTYTSTGVYTVGAAAWNGCGTAGPVYVQVQVVSPVHRVYLPLVARGLYAGDGYEPDNTPEQARPLLPGIFQEHDFAPPGDVDWVYLESGGGTFVVRTFDLEGGADTYLHLYRQDGTLVVENDDCGNPPPDELSSCITVTLGAGRYFLRIDQPATTPGGPKWGRDVRYKVEAVGP